MKIKSPKIEKCLSLDCTNPENRKKLEKAVSCFKWFKGKELSFDTAEFVLKKAGKKYGLHIQYINRIEENTIMKRDYWSLSVKNKAGLWVASVYGCTLYECLLKALVVYHGVVFEGECFRVGEDGE